MLNGLVPLALGYCEVSKGVVSKFDKCVLADVCEPLVPVLEGRYLRMECFCKERGSVGSGVWNPPTEAILDSAVDAELLIADGTPFAVNCYSIAGQRKLRQRHKTCLEMRYVKNLLQCTYMTILIHNRDRTNSDSMKSAFDAADKELVLQPCVFLEHGAVIMHMVCRSAVLDPDSIGLPYRDVSRCLIAVCEATKYGTECLAVVA